MTCGSASERPRGWHCCGGCVLAQDDLYAILPVLSIMELVIILVYLGHISGCFFYLLSTPSWQTRGGTGSRASSYLVVRSEHPA